MRCQLVNNSLTMHTREIPTIKFQDLLHVTYIRSFYKYSNTFDTYIEYTWRRIHGEFIHQMYKHLCNIYIYIYVCQVRVETLSVLVHHKQTSQIHASNHGSSVQFAGIFGSRSDTQTRIHGIEFCLHVNKPECVFPQASMLSGQKFRN